MKRMIFIAALIFFLFNFAVFTEKNIEKRAMTFEDMYKTGRLSSIKISPDGKTVLFVVKQPNLEKNKYKKDIYSIDIDGKNLKKITDSKGNNFAPEFINKSTISFISTRDGGLKLYKMSLAGDMNVKLIKNASVPGGFGSYIWTKKKDGFAFQTDIFPCKKSIEESIKKEKEIKAKGIDVKVLTSLMYRVWNYWKDGKKSHIFYKSLSEKPGVDLTPGNFDTPPLDLGGKQDFTFSPDGKSFAFVKNTDKMVAISTNNDIFIRDMKTGQERNITIDNKANDMNPVYSPNGRFLMYLSMKRAGFEADKKNIILLDLKTGAKKNLTENFKYTVSEIIFSNDSTLYFTSYESVYHPIYRVRIKKNFKRDMKLEKLYNDVYASGLTITPNGKDILFLNETVQMPKEIYKLNIRKKKVSRLSYFNKEIFANIESNKLETFTFKGAKGDMVEALLVKPPFFDKDKKYPVLFLIHGGPQGGFRDAFHYRWNQTLFAAPGFVVISINFHGSTGYGQKFTDAVSKDWGGVPFKDIVIGQKYAIETFNYIDKNKVVAAGASYGGFMINWIAGHPDSLSYQFNALVSHDGIFDARSMYYSTEELWFEEWENGGTQYDNPKVYEKHNPINYVKNFKTPMLIIHGEKDFRVPVSQGIMLFTALQRRGIKSKFLYYPNEDHFVQKPKNAQFWWKSVHGWFEENIK